MEIGLSGAGSMKIKMVVLLILWAAVFYPIYGNLAESWVTHSNNSHGILVPLISLFFVWQKREQLRSTEIGNCSWGAAILIGSTGLYVLSYAGSVAVVSRAMIVFSLAGLVLFTLGKAIFKVVAFPLLFLIFMVPVPDSVVGVMSFPLQLFATRISAFIINALFIPAYREGNMLYFAQTQLEVAEACSGIRSIMSMTMIAVIFVFISEKGRLRKLILLASVIPIALLANIFRVTATGVLAHFYGDSVARGFLHEFSGLAVFAFGLGALYLEYQLLGKLPVIRKGPRNS